MENTVDGFVMERDVRTTWIAFFTQWVLWGAVYLLRHAIGEPDKAVANEDPEVAGKKEEGRSRWIPSGPIAYRLAQAHRVLYENTMLLLGVLILNTFGNGSGRGVMILTWIYFAFTAFFAISELFYNHHLLRLGYSTIFYGLALAIGGLAFSKGWYVS